MKIHDCNFSKSFKKIGGSLLLSAFRNDELIFISSSSSGSINLTTKKMNCPTGLAVKGEKIAIGTKDAVHEYKNNAELAQIIPRRFGKADSCFVPRLTYYTGGIDIHDLQYGEGSTLWAINTAYSCICQIGSDYSFQPVWKPHFIEEIAPGDHCHLNGLALAEGLPLYTTALGNGNEAESWKKKVENGGVLIHVPSNKTILSGLSIPHSPRVHNGKLYLLLSGEEALVCVDPESGTYETVARVKGFARGMVMYEEYAIVATSKIRKDSSSFGKINIADTNARLAIINLHSGQVEGYLEFEETEEIFDVQHLPFANNSQFLNVASSGGALSPVDLPVGSHWISNMTKEKLGVKKEALVPA